MFLIDWYAEGYVNSAKQQGQCGSCYIFAAIGALEAQVKKYFNILPKLSTQQIVDCQANGCNGGNSLVAYYYLNTSVGSVLDSDYPYYSWNGEVCNILKNHKWELTHFELIAQK